MTQKILVFAGSKGSGKTSAANFVTGYTISQIGRMNKNLPVPTQFDINDDGKLVVNTLDFDGPFPSLGYGILDINNYRNKPELEAYLKNNVWPFVKIYNFAEELKRIAVSVFGLSEELVYGSQSDKDKECVIKWKDMCAFLPPRTVKKIKDEKKYHQKMTVREFLQYFGTNICRKLYDDCWIESCFKKITEEQVPIAIIDDCRFVNEVMASKKHDAKIVKLSRQVEVDNHDSETQLEKLHSRNFNLVIPPDVTIKEKNQLILDKVYEWGWFEKHVELQEV